MENYTKRSKNILSLRAICFIFLVLLIGCKSRSQVKPPIPQSVEVNVPFNSQKYDSVLYWFPDNYKINDNGLKYRKERISNIKKEYSIKQGEIFYKDKLIDKVMIDYTVNENLSKSIIIENGLPAYVYEYSIKSIPSYLYDDSGGSMPRNSLSDIFKKGYGDWREYYFVDYFNNKKYEKNEDIVLKEKGQVKNNFKYGKWEYYNKEGKIDSTKTYKLQDSVDVRFPQCIFNKNEPCY